MPEELIMRGKTASGTTETLNFGGRTPGYGYHLTDFQLYPSASLGGSAAELVGSITADDSAMDPANPDFDSPGLIGNFSYMWSVHSYVDGMTYQSVINDLFVITQDLILMVTDVTNASPINWQARFKKVKLSQSAEAVANFNQFSIYDG